MNSFRTFLLLFISSLGAFATPVPLETVKLDKLTLAGSDYVSVILTRKDSRRATLQHAGGVKVIPLISLPEALRLRLGYDAAAAADQGRYEEATAAAKATKAAVAKARDHNYQILRHEATVANITVISITGDGLLAHAGSDNDFKVIFVATPTEGCDYLTDRTYRLTLLRAGSYEYTTVLGALARVPKYRVLDELLDDLAAQKVQLPATNQ
jgi:hypothetical protein